MAARNTRPASLADIEAIVREAITTHGLAEQCDRILVAWSGGADSTALLLILKSIGFEVIAGHVDHAMRKDSAQDAEQCEQLSERLGITFKKEVVTVDPPTEARAREVRYAALEGMANAAGAAVIATGHTMDDQAETVVFRLTRGGYPMGIRRRRGRIIRPLLDLRRSDNERACREFAVPFLLDPTNEDLRFTRNRIRHTVMPQLADQVGAIAAAGFYGEAVAEASVAESDRLASVVGLQATAKGVSLDRSRLLEIPKPIRRQLLRRVLNSVAVDPSARLVADVDEKVVANGKIIAVSGEMTARIAGPQLRIEPSPARSIDLPDVRVAIPGKTPAPLWNLVIETELIDPINTEFSRGSRREALLDADALNGDMTLRSRRDGDRLHPLGMEGSKKLQDLFVDLKIPRSERDRVPIFTSSGSIVWVAPIRIDHRFAIKHPTSRALRIRLFPFLRDT